MDTNRTDVLSRHPVPRHLLTRDGYHLPGEDNRVELLEGQTGGHVAVRLRA